MNFSVTVNRAKKNPSIETELIVGKIYDLRDCSARRRSGLARGLHPRSQNFILADVINRPAERDGSQRFLTEVILMDDTTNYKITDIPQEIANFLDELLR